MAFHFANVLVFGLMAAGLVLLILTVAQFLRPRIPDPEKASIYECGERPIGPAWFAFNPRFYLVALVFVIFDVEVAFMFPVSVIFKQWVAEGFGWWAFIEIFTFVAILAVGLIYVWTKGDLAWVKQTLAERRRRAPGTEAAGPVEPARKAA